MLKKNFFFIKDQILQESSYWVLDTKSDFITQGKKKEPQPKERGIPHRKGDGRGSRKLSCFFLNHFWI